MGGVGAPALVASLGENSHAALAVGDGYGDGYGYGYGDGDGDGYGDGYGW